MISSICHQMRFRPCIDLRNGRVTQIVGSTLKDKPQQPSADSETKGPSSATAGDEATENFVSCKPASHFAELYKSLKLTGGYTQTHKNTNTHTHTPTQTHTHIYIIPQACDHARARQRISGLGGTESLPGLVMMMMMMMMMK